MQLHSITYSEHQEPDLHWVLDEVELNEVNLIVGKNATGKSRLLRAVNGLAQCISGVVAPNTITTANYKAIFIDKDEQIEYSFIISNKKITYENLTIGGKEKIIRQHLGISRIYFEAINSFLEIEMPDSMLAAATRRDSKQHSFLDKLHTWADHVRYFEFPKTKREHISIIQGNVDLESIGKKQPLQDFIHFIASEGIKRHNPDFRYNIVDGMKKIGYPITNFGLSNPPRFIQPTLFGEKQNPSTCIFIEEKGIGKKLFQHEISDGMLRALAAIIILHYIRQSKKQGLLLIDDIGEGMDFERSTKLIGYLIDIAKSGRVQLVMTTNDRFVMNKVPLEHWSIIDREAGKVSIYNQKNSGQIFSDFESLGLNNFDFFSREFFKPEKQ